MNIVTACQLRAAMHNKGYRFFDTGDYNLNLIGIRSKNLQSNEFNDLVCAVFKVAGQDVLLQFAATTDPGLSHRAKPLNDAGTAVLCPGQHKGLFQLGQHQGRYRALIQAAAVTVFRDNDKDILLDLDASSVQRGWFGINMHRAGEHRRSIQVDKWSAGCQVIADPLEFDLLMSVCEIAAERWGNRFTYTLLDEQDINWRAE